MVTRLKKAEVEFGEGVTSKGLSSLFKNTLILDRAPDGEYNGLTGKVTVKLIRDRLRLFVDVNFEDNQGNDAQLKYSNELNPNNYYIRKLFSDFKIDYQADDLDLSPLSNTAVKFVVKNNGPYCNIISMHPLKSEQLTRVNHRNRIDYEEDVKADLDINADDFEIDFESDDNFEVDFDIDEDDNPFFDREGAL